VKLYRLEIAPEEYESEAEDHDEWFTSLKAAQARRVELIAENPNMTEHRFGQDYAIHLMVLERLPPRELVLALLNRRSPFVVVREVVSAYKPAREDTAGDSIDSTRDGS